MYNSFFIFEKRNTLKIIDVSEALIFSFQIELFIAKMYDLGEKTQCYSCNHFADIHVDWVTYVQKRPFSALGMCPCKEVLHENTGNQMNISDFVLRALNAATVSELVSAWNSPGVKCFLE